MLAILLPSYVVVVRAVAIVVNSVIVAILYYIAGKTFAAAAIS